MKLDTQYVKDKLQSSKGTWPEISKATKISYSWITKFAQGRIPSPGYPKIESLYKYFKAR